jgi:RNA polymerase subunit RPABC4/transcription elongation factor Spt4
MNIDLSSLSNYVLILTAWAGAFLAALWLSLIFWVYRDIRTRTRDVFMRILAILSAAILFLPGIVVYLILRPARTLEEEYQQTLEEEALLQAIEDVQLCPGCGRRVKDPWQICPNCHTKLKKPCHVCGRLMELPWNLCPFCGTPAPGMRREGMTMDEALRSIPVEMVETPKEPEGLPEIEENQVEISNEEEPGDQQP